MIDVQKLIEYCVSQQIATNTQADKARHLERERQYYLGMRDAYKSLSISLAEKDFLNEGRKETK